MTSTQVLSEIRQHGIELRASGDRLLFRSDRSVPPELRAAMRTHTTELLALMRQLEDGGREDPEVPAENIPPVDIEKLKEAEDGFTCLGVAPIDVILCVADPGLPDRWVAFRRTDRTQQGRGDSQAGAVLDLGRAEGDPD